MKIFNYVAINIAQIEDTVLGLEEWKSNITSFYKLYDKLMFFNISKILSLYCLLTEGAPVGMLVQEIGFLFKDGIEATATLKLAIEVRMFSC